MRQSDDGPDELSLLAWTYAQFRYQKAKRSIAPIDRDCKDDMDPPSQLQDGGLDAGTYVHATLRTATSAIRHLFATSKLPSIPFTSDVPFTNVGPQQSHLSLICQIFTLDHEVNALFSLHFNCIFACT